MDTSALLLEISGENLLLVDPQTLTILAANPKICTTLAYPPEKLCGMPIGDIECALSDLFFWEEINTEGLVFKEAESSLRCQDGSILNVTKTVRRVGQSAENPAGLYALRAIVTDQQQQIASDLASATLRLRATLEATADGILLVDHEGHILNMNRRFSNMWSLPEDALLDRDDRQIFRIMDEQLATTEKTADAASCSSAIVNLPAAADPNEGQRQKIDLLHLNNGRIFERNIALALDHGQAIGRVISFRDIT